MIWSFRIFNNFLCWILTVTKPQPKVLWHVSDNLMILIRKAKLFNFLCNISAIPFTDLKVFNPGATLAIITSIYVTSKGKFSNQYIYARHKENASTHWKDFLSLEATCHHLCWWNNKNSTKLILDTVFSLFIPIENTGPLEKVLPPGCLPKGLAPLSPSLTAATNCVVTDRRVILDLSMQQLKNFHSSVYLGFTYYVLERKGNTMMKRP